MFVMKLILLELFFLIISIVFPILDFKGNFNIKILSIVFSVLVLSSVILQLYLQYFESDVLIVLSNIYYYLIATL